MMLVTGGVASGKRTYVRSLGFAEKDLAYASPDGALPDPGAPVVVDAQLLALAGPVGEGALVVYERAQAAPPLALHTARIVSRKRHGDTAVDLLRLGAAHGDAADDAAD